ncbi:hypothetical protein H072_4839 [Dactylellina haptotyla CBS 200.50]|uniref:Choline/ethanolamine kinase n=1 Tax=Dactylellina haptotyla (strain CBS 200.50) TaxID=1284197 RepID=S8AE80_DACHA|nr:hypothetical protein H072_4839 [Dactylellina haptotyla CBS 200.50]
MTTLITVPVTLPPTKVPTKVILRDIIATFLTEEWPSVEPESLITTYHETFANAHCHVSRPRPVSTPQEPLNLFIKFHKDTGADIEIFRHLVPSKQEEALFCHQYGLSGLSAKVYGFFKTQDGTLGRIDEFIDSRTLEPEDVEDATIRVDIARALATFHNLDTPLTKRPVAQFYEALGDGLQKYHKMEKLRTLSAEGGININNLIDYDFASRIHTVVERLESTGSKIAWCIHDIQYMNVLVRDRPKQNESKIVLIDFEFVMRNYRAFDIGGHFMQKMFKWFDEENKIADCRKYTEQEKRHFCEAYAAQWNEITGDEDTGEQVYVESEYGYMLAIAFDIHNMLCFMADENDKDPLNLLGLDKLYGEFVEQYDRFGLETS